LAPTNTRPRPSVGARSPKTAPGEPDVGTGTPASNRKVEPPLVALTGRLPTFWLIAEPMNEMREPLSALGRRNEVIGMERGRRIGAGRPAEEQRVLPARENEELGDLVAEPLGWQRGAQQRE